MEQDEGRPSNKGHGLVLQGGGALGAFELGAARVIFDKDSRFRPAVIAGVSIGAISAVLLGRPRKGLTPLQAPESFWKAVTVSQVLPAFVRPYLYTLAGTPNFFALNPFWMLGTSFYSVEPLRATLTSLVDLDRLADRKAEPRLLFTATDVIQGQLDTFDSRETGLTLDHVVASSSLPPSFPMTQIGETYYWDGGLFDNTPLGALIDRLEGDAEDRAVAVVNLFPNRMPLPRNMTDVGQRIVSLLFVNKTRSDIKLMNRFNLVADLMAELEKLPDDSPVKALASFKDLRAARYRRVPSIIEITRDSPAESMEASDFSEDGIARRAYEGQRAAEGALKDAKLL